MGYTMRITTRGRYALRATIAMTRLCRDGEPISIRRLSDEEDISSVFLEQIFYKLRKAGLVESVRGPGGGFVFTDDPSNISVKNVLEAAGENLLLTPCIDEGACDKASECTAHNVWVEASNTLNSFFANLTLKEVENRFTAKQDPKTQDEHKTVQKKRRKQ